MIDNSPAGRTLRSADNALIQLRNNVVQIFYRRVLEVMKSQSHLSPKDPYEMAIKQVMREWGIEAQT